MDSDISTYWVETVYTYCLTDDTFIDPFKGKLNYILS